MTPLKVPFHPFWLYILYFFIWFNFFFVLFILPLYKSLQNNLAWNFKNYFLGKKLHNKNFINGTFKEINVTYQRSFVQLHHLSLFRGRIFNSENCKSIWWSLKSFEPIIVLIPSFTQIRTPDFLVYYNLSGVGCQTHD